MIKLPAKEQWISYASLGLGLLATILLLLMLRDWHADWQLAFDSKPTLAHVTNQDETTQLIEGIPNAHLFGHAFSNSENAPLSQLQFHLTGIVKTSEKEGKGASKAYISTSGQPSKIVEVGDELPYGVKVYDITDDAVILENDGHLEKLTLQRNKLEFKPRASPRDSIGEQP